MKQKTFNNLIVVLISFAILVSIVGTILLINALSFDESEEKFGTTSAGTISLNIEKDGQEYASTGVISLNVINNDLEKHLEE